MRDVVQQGHAVALVVLEDCREALEARFVGGLAQVDAADVHRAAIGMVQAGDEAHECALASAVLAHDGDGFAGAMERVTESMAFSAGAGVAEAHPVQLHAAVARQRRVAAPLAFWRFDKGEVVAAKGGILVGKAQPVEELLEPLEDRVHGEVHRAEQARAKSCPATTKRTSMNSRPTYPARVSTLSARSISPLRSSVRHISWL